MGTPVMHFEVLGKDTDKLWSFYNEMFGWDIKDAAPGMNYGLVDRESNSNAEGIGITGGIGKAPEGYDGHVTFYAGVSDAGEALKKAESLGAEIMMGPDDVPGQGIKIGQFNIDGYPIGVVEPLGM